MENYNKSLNDNNSLITDEIIINGLHVVFDLEKVNANCKILGINENEIGVTKFSKRDNIVVVTIKCSLVNQIQYVIFNDLKLNELRLVPKMFLPKEIKNLIKQGYKMTKIERVKDMLDKFQTSWILN